MSFQYFFSYFSCFVWSSLSLHRCFYVLYFSHVFSCSKTILPRKKAITFQCDKRLEKKTLANVYPFIKIHLILQEQQKLLCVANFLKPSLYIIPLWVCCHMSCLILQGGTTGRASFSFVRIWRTTSRLEGGLARGNNTTRLHQGRFRGDRRPAALTSPKTAWINEALTLAQENTTVTLSQVHGQRFCSREMHVGRNQITASK